MSMLIEYDRYESNNNLKILFNETTYRDGLIASREITTDVQEKLPKGHVAIPYPDETPNPLSKLIERSTYGLIEGFPIYKLKKIANVEKLLKDILKTLDDYELVETENTYEITHATGRIKLYKD